MISLVGRERDYVTDAIGSGRLGSGGRYSARVQAELETSLGAPRALLTNSGSDALEMSALLLDIGPDDEVIVPTFAFVTDAGAFALRGARIVFADIRPDTLNIDEAKLASLIGPRTRAIVVVHYSGVACDMTPIMELATRRGIAVIEDLAHGPFATHGGRPLGTFGLLACLSFHETKNFSCGEGGALLINDSALIERAQEIYHKGTDRSRFFAGDVDKYTWRSLGSSYAMSDLQAAFLLGQLEARHVVQSARARLWHRYDAALGDWADAHGVGRPYRVVGDEQAYHSYFLVMPTTKTRTALIEYLDSLEITAVFHYLPLHLSKMGVRMGGRPGEHPVAESVSTRLVRLPFFTNLSDDDQDAVVAAVKAFDPGRPRPPGGAADDGAA